MNPRSWIHPRMRELRKTRKEESDIKIKVDTFLSSIRIAAKNEADLHSLITAFSPY